MGRPFVIFSDRFDDDIGGVIALHRLCDLLNRIGRRAYLWPAERPLFDLDHPWQSLRQYWRYLRRSRRRPYRTCERFVTPIATSNLLTEAIIVYPEVVDGNPLRGQRVVRWLLHKPGFHTGRVQYGPHDRYFFFQQAFDDPMVNPDATNLLKTIFVRDDIYRPAAHGEREGSCYLLRKGRDRTIVHSLEGSILVDGLSHHQMAEVFSRVQTFISYDPYTMYSYFAALCGCDSIVVPMDGVSREQWYPDPRDRYGLAYGFDDLEHARRTRALLLPHLKEQESQANTSVQRFADKCDSYFAP